jgi:large subunit ribosomal protein L23
LPTCAPPTTDGKKKRERRADFGRTKNWKKAFVRLADGETIEFV